MKFIRVQITDSMHTRLKALTSHHGEYTHMVRLAIREYVTKKEELNAKLRQEVKPPDTKVES
jgi:Fe-S cluster assembly iron-binding protein IscA